MVIGLAQFYQNSLSDNLHILNKAFVFSFWVSASLFPFFLPCALSSRMIESYSALLKSLQEVIHREGFDLSTPMVRISYICFVFVSFEPGNGGFSNYNLYFQLLSGLLK